MNLEGKTALVTGASSGIGKAVSMAMAAEGVSVGLLARSEDKLEKTRQEIEQKGGRALPVSADVSDPEQVQKAVENTVDEFGSLHIVASIAGLGIFKNVEEMSVDEWDTHINVMLRGSFLVAKYSLPHLYEQEQGHVLAVTSLWAKRFCAKCSGYTGAKFGVRGMLQSVREEARSHNVKVTNIMPGTVDTPFFEKTDWETDLTRALWPEDVAQTAVFALQLPDRAVVEEIQLQAIQPDGCTE